MAKAPTPKKTYTPEYKAAPKKKSKVVVKSPIVPKPRTEKKVEIVLPPAPHVPSPPTKTRASWETWSEDRYKFWESKIAQGKRHHSSCHQDGSTCPKCGSALPMREQYNQWLTEDV